MNPSRETIYAALAAELKNVAGLVSMSRVYRSPSDYSAAAQLPAGCTDETAENEDQQIYGAPSVYTLSVDFWLYLLAPQLSQIPGQETAIPATALNNTLDALDTAFPADASGMVNTLGGLVQHAYIQGKIQKVSGVGSGNLLLSVAKVPIQMLAVS